MDGILIIILSLLFSAFFSGMEFAFVTANKFMIELGRKQGAFGSKALKVIIDNPGQFIITLLIGNVIAIVTYGLSFSALLTPILTPAVGSGLVVVFINVVISTALLLLVAELLLKIVIASSPDQFFKVLSVPVMFFYYLFYPLSKIFIAVSDLFFLTFPGGKSDKNKIENLIFSKVDFDSLVNSGNMRDEASEPFHQNIRIFQNALDFSNVKLRECMIPRTEIVALESKRSVDELKERFIETGHSRILIFQDSIDNIIGYFELKDIFTNPPDILSSVRKLAIVPETMAANKLLKLFFDERKNVALVVDEFGGTSGMVTIEDILEEIVGDIEDEHDLNEFTEKVTGNGEYILSGRLEIDYLNEKYHLDLPEKDDYETLAGLILFYHGSIPGNNEVIRIGKFVFRILRVTATRLELVSLKTNL
jgi:CBS domain containing-hemolysin-like protein